MSLNIILIIKNSILVHLYKLINTFKQIKSALFRASFKMLKRICTHKTILTSFKLKKLIYNKTFSFNYITFNIIIFHIIII